MMNSCLIATSCFFSRHYSKQSDHENAYFDCCLYFISTYSFCQELITIDQDYDTAKAIAQKENKLLFIDFYTTWCAPCKKIDKLIFRNDTISKQLGEDFVLLRYDAEKDKKFHLSKKHHVNSYPTAIVLNSKGFVIHRKQGFKGKDVHGLSKSVFAFTSESKKLHKQNKFISGYSNQINIQKYPQFYIDFVNRDNTKVEKTDAFKKYWADEKHDVFSEEYFTPLVYFAPDVPTQTANAFLNSKAKYIDLYGENDVNFALFLMASQQLSVAVSSKNEAQFKKAVSFAKRAIDAESAKGLLAYYEGKFQSEK